MWGSSSRSTAARRSPTPSGSSGSPSASSTTRRDGHDVVVVVSAMGDTTDELIDLAEQIVAGARRPRVRHAAHRRRAHLDGAARDGDQLARATRRAVVHRLAGRRAHHVRPRQGAHRRHHARAGSRVARPTGNVAIVAGFQGVSQDTKDITTLGRGGSDTTAVALAAALSADVCEIYTDVDGVFTADPRIVPERAATRHGHLRGDARAGGVRGQDPAPAVASSTAAATACRSTSARRSRPSPARLVTGSMEELPWSRRSSPASRTTAARPRSPSSACRTSRARRPRSSASSPTAEINIDMIVQNVSTGGDRPHRRLVHAARRPMAPTALAGAAAGAGRRSASRSCSTTTTSASCRWSARACVRTPVCRRRSSPRSPTPASTSR